MFTKQTDIKMSDIKMLIKRAEARRSYAQKEAKRKLPVDAFAAAIHIGKVKAYDYIIPMLNLLLNPQPYDDTHPQLQQHECSTSLPLLQAVMEELQNTDADYWAGGEVEKKARIEQYRSAIQLIGELEAEAMT